MSTAEVRNPEPSSYGCLPPFPHKCSAPPKPFRDRDSGVIIAARQFIFEDLRQNSADDYNSFRRVAMSAPTTPLSPASEWWGKVVETLRDVLSFARDRRILLQTSGHVVNDGSGSGIIRLNSRCCRSWFRFSLREPLSQYSKSKSLRRRRSSE
jgi:hypothetical protein